MIKIIPIRILHAILLFASLSSCGHLKTFVGIAPKRPTIKIENIDFVSLDSKSLKLDLKIEVFNPNDFDLELSDIDYSVGIEGKTIARGHIKKKLLVKELQYNYVRVPIEVMTAEAGNLFKDLMFNSKRPTATWVISATFHGLLGEIDVNFENEKALY